MACRFMEDWLIDNDPAIDIATFDIAPERIRFIGRAVLTGLQRFWPPEPPKVDGRIYYCGFPGLGRTWPPPPSEICFGAVVSSGDANSVNELDISTLIKREVLDPILGQGMPPEDFGSWRDERRGDADCRGNAPTFVGVGWGYLPGAEPVC